MPGTAEEAPLARDSDKPAAPSTGRDFLRRVFFACLACGMAETFPLLADMRLPTTHGVLDAIAGKGTRQVTKKSGVA
jgi:hypothetical protein